MTPASTYRRSLAALTLFTLIGGDFWRYSISWYGWGALCLGILVASVIELVRIRPNPSHSPIPLVAFGMLIVLSLAWSDYRGVTLIAVATTLSTAVAAIFIAVALSWDELLRALGTALRWILGLSIVFELYVAAILRHPVLPFFTSYEKPFPAAFYWSRDLLLHGGQIQGVLGNSNLLGMATLIGLIVFGIQFATKQTGPRLTVAWIVVAVIEFGLTRSSTVIAALIVTLLVLLLALIIRRMPDGRRIIAYAVAAVVAAVGVVGAIVEKKLLLELLDKSGTLTGRTDIWSAVIHLASQRPVFGWGWVSYWAPWVEPFKHLAVIRGVTYLQAHDAWLDVWLQLGIVGVIVFAALVLSTLVRLWWIATEPPVVGANRTAPYSWLTLFPILIFVALVVQSFTESRLLIEFGLGMLVIFAVKSKVSRLTSDAPSR